MKIDINKRHNGPIGLSVAECIDQRFNTWRVRTDFQPYIDPVTGEESGVTFVEMEFPYKPSMTEVKDFVTGAINAQTDYKILTGLVWNDKPVWLSTENQFNFSEGERKAKDNPAILPVTYKIGQDSDGNPVYHTFTTVEEITSFYDTCFAYINLCLNEGWQRKDSIDWEPYEEALESVTE